MTQHDAQSGSIGIIAGNGRLPAEVAHRLIENGETIHVVAIAGEAGPEVRDLPFSEIEWGQIGKMFRILRDNQVDRVVLAGGVVGRPEIKLKNLDFGALMTLPGMIAAMMGGDNAILSAVVNGFEKRGFKVCSLAQLLPELCVKPGANSRAKPSKADLERINEGVKVIKALGPHDIGQACVVMGRRTVAIEGVEGTDGMLQRVADLRVAGRLPSGKGGVLVKCVKTGQDERADLPTIGPQTVANAAGAGLVGISVEAGKTLVVQRDETMKAADDAGVFIYGTDMQA